MQTPSGNLSLMYLALIPHIRLLGLKAPAVDDRSEEGRLPDGVANPVRQEPPFHEFLIPVQFPSVIFAESQQFFN